jgi:tRNA pseudouridine55 synthase
MRRRLDAVLLLDKPSGMTSNAAMQRARRLYGAEKAGHAGTLDPLASGLLPVLFGEATKFSQSLLDSDKEYLAQARLGVTTATGDAEGEVLERRAVEVGAAAIEAALARFRGPIEQVPPMHSALKVGGRPLYALARRGMEVERAPRRVTIHALELLGREGETLRLRVRCSKGTYVRTLVEDLGAALGTGAHLAGLRRTAAGGFGVAQAVSLEALDALDDEARDRRLLAVDALLEGLPRVILDETQARGFLQGRSIALSPGTPGRCRAYGPGGVFLGVGERTGAGELKPRRLLATG